MTCNPSFVATAILWFGLSGLAFVQTAPAQTPAMTTTTRSAAAEEDARLLRELDAKWQPGARNHLQQELEHGGTALYELLSDGDKQTRRRATTCMASWDLRNPEQQRPLIVRAIPSLVDLCVNEADRNTKLAAFELLTKAGEPGNDAIFGMLAADDIWILDQIVQYAGKVAPLESHPSYVEAVAKAIERLDKSPDAKLVDFVPSLMKIYPHDGPQLLKLAEQVPSRTTTLLLILDALRENRRPAQFQNEVLGLIGRTRGTAWHTLTAMSFRGSNCDLAAAFASRDPHVLRGAIFLCSFQLDRPTPAFVAKSVDAALDPAGVPDPELQEAAGTVVCRQGAGVVESTVRDALIGPVSGRTRAFHVLELASYAPAAWEPRQYWNRQDITRVPDSISQDALVLCGEELANRNTEPGVHQLWVGSMRWVAPRVGPVSARRIHLDASAGLVEDPRIPALAWSPQPPPAKSTHAAAPGAGLDPLSTLTIFSLSIVCIGASASFAIGHRHGRFERS